MMYQCAPDEEDVLARRRLEDGRELAVFANRLCERRTIVEERRERVVAGEVVVYLRRSFHEVRVRWVIVGYALVITDDTGMPEKWRTLAWRRRAKAIIKLFTDFQEGDDDRRKVETPSHPFRRAADRRQLVEVEGEPLSEMIIRERR